LYASTIAFQWLAVAVVGWRVWVHGYSARQLGLVFHGRTRLLLGGLVGAAIMGGLQWLNLRRVGRIPPGSRGGMQAGGERILPQSSLGQNALRKRLHPSAGAGRNATHTAQVQSSEEHTCGLQCGGR